MGVAKVSRRARIKRRIRLKIHGTSARPRMCVFRSNKGIYVQFIDDDRGVTLASAASSNKAVVDKGAMTKIAQAQEVGKLAAEAAKSKGISTVVFDRSGYLYHGRVKALADSAREGGLVF